MSQESIPAIVENLRRNFNQGKTRSLEYRQQQLTGIMRFFTENQQEIYEALRQDMGKPYLEAFSTEYAFILAELKLMQKKLVAWSKPERVSTSLWGQPGKSFIYPEPYGVVLIIAPWNYPVQLALLPLIGAIAAGNCAVLKPSEIAPATSRLIATKLPQYVDNTVLQVAEGDAAIATQLLAQKFDYIFYTGNGTVGRIVMEAAAKNLTPVTLELGGKSPCIVDQDTNIHTAARRILLGKFFNAGHTCVAPDHVLVHEAVEDALLAAMKKILTEFYGADAQQSSDYARIINTHHFRRLMNLLSGSGEICIGGKTDEQQLYIEPTILRNVPENAPIMQEEIFGPILPVLKVKNIDEAITFVNTHPKPLAVYVFSNNKEVQQRILAHTSSGTAAINTTGFQFLLSSLPVGGVGASGMGAYHGKATFDTFSHHKGVLVKSTRIDPPLIYPPYTKTKFNLIRALFLRKFWK